MTFARGPITGRTANITVQAMAGSGCSSGSPSGGTPSDTVTVKVSCNAHGADAWRLRSFTWRHEPGPTGRLRAVAL
ncbi:hypothetical protein F0U63_23470 [Cystobacter fuscus]|nr:hypothetical protein F0U63_23470 [Cystobacter fuscus]